MTDRHEHGDRSAERIDRRPLAITSVFLVAEVIGGLLTNSLALLADAGHMATDVAALALALFAIWLARRPATPERSFGFAEIIQVATSSDLSTNTTMWMTVTLDPGPYVGLCFIPDPGSGMPHAVVRPGTW